MIRNKRPDPSMAKDLVAGSNKRFKLLVSISEEDDFSNFIIENSYDVLRELIESKLSNDGYKSSTHKDTIQFLSKFDIHPAEIKFLDEMRKIRNNIKYEGKYFDLEYALKVKEFTIRMRKKLLKLL